MPSRKSACKAKSRTSKLADALSGRKWRPRQQFSAILERFRGFRSLLIASALILPATARAADPRGTPLLPGDVVIPGSTAAPSATPAEMRLRAISIVVLDPGHGGDDTGVRASTATPIAEKDLALELARRIEALVTSQTGARVLLSRAADVHLATPDRTSFANEARADLFLSIHANGSPSPSAHGFRVYYHDSSSADAGPAAAGPAPALAWPLAQRDSESKSAHFAELLRESLTTKVAIADRGVKRVPMSVLEGSTCPSVVLEIGFLSNKDEALALSTSAVQDAIAQAVADAIQKMDATLAGAEGTP